MLWVCLWRPPHSSLAFFGLVDTDMEHTPSADSTRGSSYKSVHAWMAYTCNPGEFTFRAGALLLQLGVLRTSGAHACTG